MNSLQKHFTLLKKQKRKLFLPFVTLWDPDKEYFLKILKALENNGADAIEIGIPFSDPMADGPVIQKASIRALNKGASLIEGFKMLENIKKQISVPILFMSYYNPVFMMGEERFFKVCEKTKLDGIIIPDLSFEESKKFIKNSKAIDLASICFISPTTPSLRMKKINSNASGFIYYISIKGVTGQHQGFEKKAIEHIKLVKKNTTLPVCVGFGISTAKQAKTLAEYADGIIIGSAIVKIIEKNINNKKMAVDEIAKFTRRIRSVLDGKKIPLA
ncbi:MAG: tryptophan synthase subunit alpha [Candidatus Saelkia tenebricola]|nr:tryptophan synthase subunit alpha [Candidatus Saelkia tenebricola]